MSIAINILLAVLKSVLNNKIGNELTNELIGISIDGISEKGINMISDYIDKERTKINYILSKDNMKSLNIPKENVDYVIAEIKDILSKIKVTDEVFRQCKYNSMDLSGYLLDEYRVHKDGYIECESNIKNVLYSIADALIELLRESEQFEKDFLIQISNSVDDTNVEIQKISEYMQENFNQLDTNNQELLGILYSILKQIQSSNMQNKKQNVKSRTQEYADKWNENMFLNDFDKRDKAPGVNVKLKDVYLESHLPNYIWKDNPEDDPSTDLKDLLTEYIDKKIDNKMLLILGQPGIGKSTLITWITANFTNRVDDIMIYQFAADLKDIDWQKANISIEILDALNLSYGDLNDKTLILDGLDEISVGDRREILDKIYWELIKGRSIERFSLIITCRENYINSFERIQCTYITLLPWDKMQIKSFCTLYQEKTKGTISENTIAEVIENKEILGIPLILYMVLALNISIEKGGYIVDIYDKIFSLEGGIYDRCIENKNFAIKHRIGNIKKQIHQISREIAIWMFENNPNETFIPQKEYERICDGIIEVQRIGNEDIQQDFLIGNFFKLRHCEGVGTEKLYFVHRSIYEYFVAETIYSSIENAMIELTQESQLDLAEKIAFYLKEGVISPTIGEYLQHKIIKLYNGMIIEKKQNFFQWWENTVEKMMEVGMFYYTKMNIQIYPNIIAKEVQCFINLVEVLRLLVDISDNKYILTNINNKVKEKYIRYCSMKFGCSNLSRVYLSNINLSKTNLCSVNLNNSYLYKVNLFGAYLSNAELNGAYLEEIDLREADLNGSSLEGAHLKNVDLRRTYFNEAVLQRDDIQDILPQIKASLFSSIIIKDQNEMNEVGRSELFPEESILLTEERNFNKDGAYNKWFI